MNKTYKAKITLEVEITATNAPEADEILSEMYGCDNSSLEVKVLNCDVDVKSVV